MNRLRLVSILTGFNIAVLGLTLHQARPAAPQDIAPVLRGRALEIVDDQGRPRATITVFPAEPAGARPDGTVGQGFPETVLLRLIDPNGRPNVKIQSTERGGGFGLGGADDPTYVLLGAEGDVASLKLTNADGKQELVRP